MPEQFKLAASTITATNDFTLIAVSTVATAMIRSITLCNKSTAFTTSVDVKLFVSSDSASYFLFRYTQLTSAETVMPLSTPIVVTAGNQLRLVKGPQDLDATATFLELT